MGELPNPSREFHWVSALDPRSLRDLQELNRRMKNWYANRHDYYQNIDFTRDNWVQEPAYRWIAKSIQDSERILEIGCGRANILEHHAALAIHYTGTDFSPDLIKENSTRFPGATFSVLKDPANLAFESARFDAVIAVFVLEHCVYPHLVLNEWVRVLRAGGRLLILCPDFLGRGLISSQRVGFSEGTGREKIAKGKFLDAAVTGIDTRVRMRLKAGICRRHASNEPRFYINLAPVCFRDSFRPDVDAVYLTYETEILSWLRKQLRLTSVPRDLREYLENQRTLLITGQKR